MLPEVGPDFPSLIAAFITALGSAVTVCVAGYFAFLLVRKVVVWGNGIDSSVGGPWGVEDKLREMKEDGW